jgi:phage terminase large subunit-like protein
VTDWRFVTQRITQIADTFDIQEIAYDRWGARDTVADLTERGLTVHAHGQGYAEMNAPSKRLFSSVLSRNLVHNGHPVLRWNVDCCSVSGDAADNIKPVKPERGKSNKRIDGVIAAVMALGRAVAAEDNITYTRIQVVG